MLASVTLVYQFLISAPTDTTVPVNISASGEVGSFIPTGPGLNGTLVEQSSLTMTPAGGSSVINQTASNSGSSSFNINQTFGLSTNTVYTLDINTFINFLGESNQLPSDFSAGASLDPTITLDTTDPAYSLEFSPGLFPSATPEPPSLILLGTGIAAAFTLARRRFQPA